MNDFIAALVLAVVQGIAEWFPVSSSAHLVIVGQILGITPSLQLTVALHFGTLMAVFVYFGKDITEIIKEFCSLQWHNSHGKMGIFLIIATIPIAIIGFFIKSFMEASLGNFVLLAFGLGITSMMLFIGSLDIGAQQKTLSYKNAFLIGLAQVASLFRGISRSGSTITAGLLLGLDMKEAVKFSFLLSIPTVFGANILSLGSERLTPDLLIPSLVSFFVGLCVIHFSFHYVLTSRRRLMWFGVYTLLLSFGIFMYLVL